MTDVAARLSVALTGRYRIERELGAGGMATVYLAEDLRHTRRVAIKVLRPELGAVIGAERFLQEIRTTAGLSHPHILPLFDSGEADGLLYYVMPFVEGETLRARLNREHQLSVDEAVRIAREIADALQYAHDHGVIHRDIKPENILLAGGRPLVADFGIALAVSAAAGSRMTETGLSLGTPHYMSPEQATADREISGRSDIYSLASVLYEMLAGEPPHGGGTSQQVIARIITEEPRPIDATRRSVPAHVAAAINRALEKLPADRFASGKEFADALASPTFGYTSGARAAATAPAKRGPMMPWAVAAVASIAAIGLALSRGEATADAPVPIRYNVELSRSTLGYVGVGNTLALSPNGDAIALAGVEQNGTRVLFIRRASDGVLRVVPASTNARNPFFSRDGQWIGFVRGGMIYRADALRGDGATQVMPAWSGRVSWSSKDELVQSNGRVLMKARMGDASWKPFTELDSAAGETAQLSPLLLDDDETVLYTSFSTGGPGNARIGVASLSGDGHTLLPVQGAYALGVIRGHLIYSTAAGVMMAVPFDVAAQEVSGSPINLGEQLQMEPSGEPFATLSSQGHLLALAGSSLRQLSINEPGTVPRALDVPAQNIRWPRLSPDASRVAMTITKDGQTDVWVYTLPDGPLAKVTNAGLSNDRPEWSPDGRSLLYRSSRGTRNALWIQSVDGMGEAKTLLSDPRARIEQGVLSPDGRWLVYQADSTGVADLWVQSMEPDATPRAVAVTEHAEHGGRFSPDGRWIAYTSLESGTSQVYVQPFPSLSERYQISLDGGSTPVWSRDGRALYYVAGTVVTKATVQFEPTFVVRSREVISRDQFSFTVIHADYDVFPDGRRMIGLVPTSLDTRLVMTHNWAALISDRLGGRPQP